MTRPSVRTNKGKDKVGKTKRKSDAVDGVSKPSIAKPRRNDKAKAKSKAVLLATLAKDAPLTPLERRRLEATYIDAIARRRTERERKKLNVEEGLHISERDAMRQRVQDLVATLPNPASEEQVSDFLDGFEGLLDQSLKSWSKAFPDETYNELFSDLSQRVGGALAGKGLEGYAIQAHRSGARLIGPPPASSRGFSGSARSDKWADMPPNWRNLRLGALTLAQLNQARTSRQRIRHVTLDYGQFSNDAERRPGQSAAMAKVTPESLGLDEAQTTVSPNLVRGTETAPPGDPRSGCTWSRAPTAGPWSTSTTSPPRSRPACQRTTPSSGETGPKTPATWSPGATPRTP